MNHLQVHKILKSSDVTTDFSSITTSLNSIVKQFLILCQCGRNVTSMNKTLEDIAKIQKCSSKIHSQTKYASLMVSILLQLFKLLAIDRKRLADGHRRVLCKIKSLVYDLCLLENTYSGSANVSLIAKLIKYYCLQFLKKHISGSEVSDKELSAYRKHLIDFSASSNTSLPPQIIKSQHFNLFLYLSSLETIISPDIQHSTATILSPQTNTDRIHEFPSHLSHSIQVEAETEHCDPNTLAVNLRYPGDRDVICQPALQNQLSNYYQITVFVGSSSWSDPGIIDVGIVSDCLFGEHEVGFQRLHGNERIWLGVSENVQIKVHPRIPR